MARSFHGRQPCAVILAWVLILHIPTPAFGCKSSCRYPRRRTSVLAFAGGGFGSGSSKSAKSNKSKRRRRSGLATEVPVQAPPTEEAHESSPLQSSTETPVLDKWGLPIPTEDDLYPPLPEGTLLVPIRPDESITLIDIESALRDHIPLDLSRFDETGVEKLPRGRPAMTINLLHRDPPVLSIDNFFSDDECEDAKGASSRALEVGSKTFSPLATSRRTSTSWFCFYKDMAPLLAKAHFMLGIPISQMEEPQVVRYRKGEEFTWHYDEVPPTQLDNGGQRVATLLVYLNSVETGGGTIFRELKDGTGNMLTMKPKKGSALLFFPAFSRDGHPDDRTLHKGEPAEDEKWITQMWIHERPYSAVVPPGNSHEAAQSAVDAVSAELGYA